MERFSFATHIDIPLVIALLGVFLFHFRRYSVSTKTESTLDLQQRLPAANVRIVIFLVLLVSVCWFLDVALWIILAVIFAVGCVIGLVDSDTPLGRFGMLGSVGFLIRECCFGFPELILHPDPDSSESSTQSVDELLGRHALTLSPLRPSGDIEVDGLSFSAVSATGEWIEKGATVNVTDIRNGRPAVSPIITESESK
ncbi:MAG: NfeD family protein [Planctomycetota bacterium]